MENNINKEEVQRIIKVLVDTAENSLKRATTLAEQHGLEFYFKAPGQASAQYSPHWVESYGELEQDLDGNYINPLTGKADSSAENFINERAHNGWDLDWYSSSAYC